jgi:uncharacterized SAM-dependent methyltransferase
LSVTSTRDLRKVFPLLQKLDQQVKSVVYYGLDLSLPVLQEGIGKLNTTFKHVKCVGLWGTFDDALTWVERIPGPRWFLSLGSILGNDFPEPAIQHLTRWSSLLGADDRMLIGMDATDDPGIIWDSYHDDQGLFEQFMRGGLEHSNRVVGEDWQMLLLTWSAQGLIVEVK